MPRIKWLTGRKNERSADSTAGINEALLPPHPKQWIGDRWELALVTRLPFPFRQIVVRDHPVASITAGKRRNFLVVVIIAPVVLAKEMERKKVVFE
jgi:hypothetical protein